MKEREVANALLSKHAAIAGVPVNPAAIARAEGIEVAALDPLAAQTASGWFRIVDGIPKIYFNAGEPPRRQRFTIAHELGHYALGHGERPRDNARDFSLAAPDGIEISANRFAAELLMPGPRVWAAVNGGKRRVEDLANYFDVSEVAMGLRLKHLGILG